MGADKDSMLADILAGCAEFVYSKAYVAELESKFADLSAQKCAANNLLDLEDSLFWAIFASRFGAQEFVEIAITDRYKNREIAEKTAIAARAIVRSGANALNGTGLSRPALAAIAGGLMADAVSNLSTLPVFAAYYCVYIRVVDPERKTYLDIIPSGVDCTHFAEIAFSRSCAQGRAGKNTYVYMPVWQPPSLNKNCQRDGRDGSSLCEVPPPHSALFKLDSISRPLRAISSYTIAELKVAAAFLGVETETNATKRIIYDALTQHCIPPECSRRRIMK